MSRRLSSFNEVDWVSGASLGPIGVICRILSTCNAGLVRELDFTLVLNQPSWLGFITVKCVIEYRSNESVRVLSIREMRRQLCDELT